MIVRDDKQEEFTKTLPCNACRFITICKYYNTFKPSDNIPEFMEVSYVCKKKEELERPTKKEFQV